MSNPQSPVDQVALDNIKSHPDFVTFPKSRPALWRCADRDEPVNIIGHWKTPVGGEIWYQNDTSLSGNPESQLIWDDGLDFTLDDIAELNPDPDSDPIADMATFARILHQGGAHRFTQDTVSGAIEWSRVDEPMRLPKATGKEQIYFSINPVTQRVTDADRINPKHKHKTDAQIEKWVASKNRTIAALNNLYREFDGKDFTDPSQAETIAQYEILRANPDKAKSTDDALLNEAVGAAKSAKYKTNPAKYKAMALAHVLSLTPAPSVIIDSGGGYQCYWLLDEPFNIRTHEHDYSNHITLYAADIQKRWVKMDAHADQGVHDIRRIFRPVGTYNHKPAYGPKFPKVSFVKKDFELRYSLPELVALLPEVKPKAPKTSSVTTRKATQATTEAQDGEQEPYEGDSVIHAYNAKHQIKPSLTGVGYTEHGDRLMRPGGDGLPGVTFDAAHPNQSFHHSTNDPLHNGYWRRPFDVFLTYTHKGNLKKAVYAAAVELGMVKHADVTPIIDTLRLWIKTSNLAAQLVGPGSKKIRLVVDAILDVMQANNRLSITAGKKRLAALAGVSPNTVKNVLALVNAKLFDVQPAEFGDQITLLSNCRLQFFDPSLDVVSCLTTGGQKTANDENEYSIHKADDAFATGTSRHMKVRIAEIAKDLDLTFAEAKAGCTFRGLGEGVLLARDTWLRIGDFTAQEYAEETGLKLSTVRGPLRYAETLGLATTEREGSRGPKVYSFDTDFWLKVSMITPNLRTYKISSQREAKRLESAQQWTQAAVEKAMQAGDLDAVNKLAHRFAKQAKQRIPHLRHLHPDLSTQDIERLAYEVAAYKRRSSTQQAITTERTEQRDAHRANISLIRELAYEFIKEFAAAGLKRPTMRMIKAKIMEFGVFDENTVGAVLWSQNQMSQYEAARS